MNDRIVIHWDDKSKTWNTCILHAGIILLEIGNFESKKEARLMALCALEHPHRFPPALRVSEHPRVARDGDKWIVRVEVDGYRTILGPLATEEEAIQAAYDLDQLTLSDPNAVAQLKRLAGDTHTTPTFTTSRESGEPSLA